MVINKNYENGENSHKPIEYDTFRLWLSQQCSFFPCVYITKTHTNYSCPNIIKYNFNHNMFIKLWSVQSCFFFVCCVNFEKLCILLEKNMFNLYFTCVFKISCNIQWLSIITITNYIISFDLQLTYNSKTRNIFFKTYKIIYH